MSNEPRRFTLTGPRFIGTGADRVMKLSSIDPRLERDEVVQVIEAEAYDALVASRSRLLASLETIERGGAGDIWPTRAFAHRVIAAEKEDKNA